MNNLTYQNLQRSLKKWKYSKLILLSTITLSAFVILPSTGGLESNVNAKQQLSSFMMDPPCGEPDWNDSVIKATLTGDFHIPGTGSTDGPLAVFVDSNLSGGVQAKNNSYSNEATFTVDFAVSTVLHGIEVVTETDGQGGPITSAVVRVEGSNDGTTYTAITSDLTYNTDFNLAAPQYGAGTNAYTWPFAGNSTAYRYYRVYAVSMTTQFGPDFLELNFDYDFFDAKLTNQSCNDNGTFEDYTDDQVTFDLDPNLGTAGNTYSVSIDGGFTITPATGTYGSATTFTVSSGSSGAGDLSLTLNDANVPCEQVITIPNTENACIPGACGGPDWNLPAIKSTITGMWDVPGTPTGSTMGTLAVLVDNDNSTGFSTKTNSFTNESLFDITFTVATVLTGIEVVVNSTGSEPINSGTFVIEGSNDGTTYTQIGGTFTHGGNLNIGSPQYGTGTRAYTFPFINTDTYLHYRVFATQMSTQFGRNFYELYFDYEVYDAEPTNITFGDNGTPGVFSDDVIDFDMDPSPGTGTYSVQVDGGAYTVTPSTGTYGQVTSFQVSSGSAGTGDITLRVTDQAVPCVQEVTLVNPDLTATVEATQAVCASPTDSPLSTITITTPDDLVYTKAEFNIGAAYAGTGFASATDLTSPSSGFDLVSNLPNPDYTTYYTVRAYSSETLFRDFVVSVEPKVCSVADLSVTVAPLTQDANEGEQLTYVVTLANAGPDPALNVEVKVDIPIGLEVLAASSSVGDYSPGTQLWTTDLVPVGSYELSITYRMK